MEQYRQWLQKHHRWASAQQQGQFRTVLETEMKILLRDSPCIYICCFLGRFDRDDWVPSDRCIAKLGMVPGQPRKQYFGYLHATTSKNNMEECWGKAGRETKGMVPRPFLERHTILVTQETWPDVDRYIQQVLADAKQLVGDNADVDSNLVR